MLLKENILSLASHKLSLQHLKEFRKEELEEIPLAGELLGDMNLEVTLPILMEADRIYHYNSVI